jgi:predicted RecB family nuclease
VVYDFDAALGTRSSDTLWSIYLQACKAVETALQRPNSTRAALSAMCKVCVWRPACLNTLERTQDLTLLPDLGRKRRDALARAFPTLADLAGANIDQHVHGRKTDFAGVGVDMLRKFQARAWLATSPHPVAYLKKPIVLPDSATELFFDIETDPMRDLCYLHGIVIREHRDPATERFYAFFAEGDTPEAERDAFAAAWALLSGRADAAIYLYSTYERTVYRKLAQKYPDVCSGEAVEALFASARLVDLYYDIVLPNTEWPTRDFSIKSIAKYLGFCWRDSNPSGAASIEWFDHYMQTRDTKDRQRILDYNEDDCVAMRVLVDALRSLPVRLT